MSVNHTMLHGDCFEVLGRSGRESVDVVITDPPYNQGKNYGTVNDNVSEAEYVSRMKTIINRCKWVARKGVVVFTSGKRTKLFWDLLGEDAHLIPVHKRAQGVKSNGYILQYHSILSTAPTTRPTKDLWDDIRLPGEGYFFKEEIPLLAAGRLV
jgi:hypothetical protein